MNFNIQNRTIKILLLLTIVSHQTFFHNLLDDYVICYGNDGHVNIENVNECDECSDVKFNEHTKVVEITSQDCEDVALDLNCFEDAQLITKDKLVLPSNLVKLGTTIEYRPSKKEFLHFYTNHNLENPILESYTSISILI